MKTNRKRNLLDYSTNWRKEHPKEFDKLLWLQNGKCAVCLNSFVGRTIHVDHDHKTHKVRGLLCFVCNRFRVAKSTIEYAESVYRYLVFPPAEGLVDESGTARNNAQNPEEAQL